MPRTLEREDTSTEQAVDTRGRPEFRASWSTVVWDDPVNLMNYVSFVFRSYFGITHAEADRLMLLVHNEGRAVVASGNREAMERHVGAMHGYGLQASVIRADA